MPKVLGLVNLHDSPIIEYINESRSIASTSFLGRYTFIDFNLSNFSNSGIDMMGILVRRGLRSLIKHVGLGNRYNLNTKNGFCLFMYNEKDASLEEYNNDINNLIENHWILDQSNADYIVIAPCHQLYRFDFKQALDYHIKNKAQVTMLYTKIDEHKDAYFACDELEIDENGRVLDINKYSGRKKVNLSLETYIISRSKLEEILDFSSMTSKFFSLKDVLKYIVNQLYIHSYEYKGYFRCISSLNEYTRCSLELLDLNKLGELFDKKWPIYTRTFDTPPAKYLNNADVKNSFISNGVIIDGKVEHSIIGRSVVIEKNSIIKDSIIMEGVHIGPNLLIENAVIDKQADVIHAKKIVGKNNKIAVVKEKESV